jgi:hypothetical protein
VLTLRCGARLSGREGAHEAQLRSGIVFVSLHARIDGRLAGPLRDLTAWGCSHRSRWLRSVCVGRVGRKEVNSTNSVPFADSVFSTDGKIRVTSFINFRPIGVEIESRCENPGVIGGGGAADALGGTGGYLKAKGVGDD